MSSELLLPRQDSQMPPAEMHQTGWSQAVHNNWRGNVTRVAEYGRMHQDFPPMVPPQGAFIRTFPPMDPPRESEQPFFTNAVPVPIPPVLESLLADDQQESHLRLANLLMDAGRMHQDFPPMVPPQGVFIRTFPPMDPPRESEQPFFTNAVPVPIPPVLGSFLADDHQQPAGPPETYNREDGEDGEGEDGDDGQFDGQYETQDERVILPGG